MPRHVVVNRKCLLEKVGNLVLRASKGKVGISPKSMGYLQPKRVKFVEDIPTRDGDIPSCV
jgi:hypothetical protein